MEVRLGNAPEATLAALRTAVHERTQIELDYYTFGRDELTTRTVDPARVFSDHGNWYLHGWCHRAGDERVFRIDRIREIRALDTPVEHELLDAGGAAPPAFMPGGDDPRVELRLAPSEAWVVEQYPTEAAVRDADGSWRVRLAVTAVPWLERLLLRLGPGAEVLAADEPLDASLMPRAARRVLARYRT